jgi:hypothetical protein
MLQLTELNYATAVGHIKVSMMVKEIAKYEWISGVEQFKNQFHKELDSLHISKAYYQPRFFYKCFVINDKYAEIWKLNVHGERKCIIFKVFK